MTRKTIEIDYLKQYANSLLNNPKLSQELKEGVATLLEYALHTTGNYKGFQYTHWLIVGCNQWKAAGEPGFPEKKKYLGPEYDRVYQ